ncbi:MAG: hypothetical protein QG657_839 [Acidobacteriota bacterium]|nr:hypothetical protein [Acidobacteriota bacterium]
MVYLGYLMKDQSFHRSQALEVKLWNLEDVSEEREMSGSIVLNRQSAKPWEALTFQSAGCCPVKSSSTAPGIESICSKKFTRQTKYFGG